MDPICELFLTDDDTTFLLQSFAPKENGLTEASLSAIQDEKMRRSAGQILFGDLQAFSSRVPSNDYRVCNFYPHQQCRYRMITVSVQDNDGFRIEVWHIDQIYVWRGSHGEVLSVPGGATDLEVYEAVMTAFGRCRDFLWLGVPHAPLPYVEVYQSESLDRISIICWVDIPLRVPGRAITLWGYPLTMSRREFMERGRRIIDADQREYNGRSLDHNPSRRPSPAILKRDGYLDQKKISIQFDIVTGSFRIFTYVFSEQSQVHEPEGPPIQIAADCSNSEFYDAIFKALSRSTRVDD